MNFVLAIMGNRDMGRFWKVPLKAMSDLALDAPLATAAWWALVDRSFGSGSQPSIGVALFFGVWAIYLCDRLYDARKLLDPETPLPSRKRFAQRNRKLMALLAALALMTACAIGFCFVPVRVWVQAGVGGILTLLYFLCFRRLKIVCALPMKEAMIATCFAGAVGIPFEPAGPWLQKGGVLLSLAGLCLLNCLFISRAEAVYDRISDPSAWFAGRDRSFPFGWGMLGWGFGTAIALLGSSGEMGFVLVFSWVALAMLIRFHDPDPWLGDLVQPLADAAIWVPALAGLILMG